MSTTTSHPSLRGKVALVTGGGTGIGRGIALALARQGADLALVGRRIAPLEATAAEAQHFGVRVVTIAADIASEDGRSASLEQTHAMLGPLDLLIHAAGVLAGGDLHTLDQAEVAEAVATNVAAPILLTRAALPQLVARRGAVVLIGSGTSLVPLPAASVYSATKAGVRAFGVALRYELEPQGVRVLLVYPPATDTHMVAGMASGAGIRYPVARPEAIGERIVTALLAGHQELYFSGPERWLAISHHIAPRLTRRALGSQHDRFARMMAAPRMTAHATTSPPPGYDLASRLLWERFQAFERAYPPTHTLLDGHRWAYRRTDGNADGSESPTPASQRETIVVLPGVPGQAEHSFAYMDALADEYRVLCLSYPASFTRLDALAEGMIALLRHEHVERAHLIGGSYGAMVAQEVARRAPGLVSTLILEHPDAPRPARARWLAPLLRTLILCLPISPLHRLILLSCRPHLTQMTQGRAFWRDRFCHTITHLSRRDCLARLAVLRDYDAREEQLSGERSLPMPVLLVEAGNDALVSRRERQRIRAHYPSATVITLDGASHVGSLEHPERYVAIFRRFLAQVTTTKVRAE